MTRVEIKDVLERASGGKLICNIYFKYEAYYFNLIPIIFGEKLFLCANENDFTLDGYSIRRYKDIKKVKVKDDKCNEILRKEGVVVSTPEVSVESWQAVFEALKNLGKNVIVEREDLDDDNRQFVIGKIDGIYKSFVYVYHFDADGIWDDEPYKIPYNEITSVTFDSRYVEIFSKYVGEPQINGEE